MEKKTKYMRDMTVLALHYAFGSLHLLGFNVYPCLVLHFSINGTIVSCRRW